MSAYYDTGLVSLAVSDSRYIDLASYDDLIEHDGQFCARSLQAIAEDVYNDTTLKTNYDIPQGYTLLESYPHQDDKLPVTSDAYDMNMSTPPLSPSTTVSSLHTDEYAGSYYVRHDEPLVQQERKDVFKGKQTEIPLPEENSPYDELAAQEDAEWYGMQYALKSSRFDARLCPPRAGESSTSDAAFVAMFDGYITQQEVEPWYARWRKWHRALSREEKRRERAASDANYTRAYRHYDYAQWEHTERKKYTYPAPGSAVGSKPMTDSRNRHRSPTCLF